jgi:acyl-CoA synthetase (AMP-forming)/AMP-acid ligase II
MNSVFDVLQQGRDNATAIATPGAASMPYRELRETVQRLVTQLQSVGVQTSDRVAIVLNNGPDMAVMFLAAASCAAAAPLNPRYRREEFQFYLEDLGAKVLITRAGEASEAEAAVPDSVQHLTLEGRGKDLHLLADAGVEDSEVRYAGRDDVALVLHTSGTTSRPKIVPLRQRNLAASARNIAAVLQLTEQDTCLNVMPLFHIHGLIAGLLAPLSAGGAVACTPGFDGFKFFDWLDELRPTWYTAVPTMHQMVLARSGKHRDIIQRVPLRFARSSSASLPTPVLERITETFGIPVIEAYGMTEATHQMSSNPLPPDLQKPGSVGKATGIEMAVMDETGKLLPAHVRGEVVIRGTTVIDAYENNPDANTAAFTNGWFRTGDQGYFDDDGYLFLTGRLKEIINRGGEKISPLEVDEVLLRHDAVAQAVTFALPHAKLGEEVAAAVVLRDGVQTTEEDIRAYAAEHLADFKVPRKVLFLSEIPKGPTGKVQRIGLAEKLELT